MKKITAIVLTLALFFVAIPSFGSGIMFADGGPVSSLEYLEDIGVITGYEDGQLHPERTLTRAEFATMLSRAFSKGFYYRGTYEFTDLPYTHWAYQYVHRAVNSGWLKGNGDGTISPDDNVTYQQVVTVMCRIAGLEKADTVYPEGYIELANKNSLTQGVSAITDKPINRANAAQLIVNTLNYNKNNPHDKYDYIEVDEDMEYSTPSMSGGGGAAGGGGGGGAAYAPSYYYDYEYDSYTNNESYTSNEENVFKDAITSPLSTFSIDADTASYSNMRRFIMNRQNIPEGAIRTEELINYFDYAKVQPTDGSPFGVNYEVSDCPWNEENMLAMITVSGEEITEPMPSNIVFLVDVSGSMDEYNKLPFVKASLSMLIDTLGENDKISVVTYASGVRVALEPTPASDKEKILGVINNLHAYGSTAGASGIQLAYQQAEKYKCDGNNRIILCTDGDFNVGMSSDGDLQKLIEEKRESGIFLSILGFGMGNYKDSRMELLADKGNGNYAYIDTLMEAKRVMVDEMSKTIYTIAKDVKLQVEFNPEKVKQYRLVGYENRVLNNEDFENDQKDAGELGAGATVTVLYEIVPADGTSKSNLKYQTVKTNGSDELMNVKIRYKLPDGEESILKEYPVMANKTEMSDDFKFASAVAMFGMLLNDSQYKGTSSLESITELAQQGSGADEYGLRREFVQLVKLYKYQQNK